MNSYAEELNLKKSSYKHKVKNFLVDAGLNVISKKKLMVGLQVQE